jgi:predicted CopG family antitoxin
MRMSRTITVSDHVYERLEAEARARGMKSIEQLLEQLPLPRKEHEPLTEEELQRRREVVDRTHEIYEELSQKYGMMPDSVDLIREDRER